MVDLSRNEDQCATICRVLQFHHYPYFQAAETPTATIWLLLQYKETHNALLAWIADRVFPQLDKTQSQSNTKSLERASSFEAVHSSLQLVRAHRLIHYSVAS
jgi:hypothetical protein